MDLQSVNTTISGANQTAVPSSVRKILDLKPGDKLNWKVDKKAKTISLKPVPRLWGTYMRGRGKEIWKGVNVEEYIRAGRQDRKIR